MAATKTIAASLVLAVAAVASAFPADAQTPCAAPGRILDPSGAMLPGATITAAGQPVIVSAGDGTFCLTFPAGDYQLQVTLDGFAPTRHTVRLPRPAAAGPIVISLAPEIRTTVVVTATRTSRRLDDVPVRTEVISRDLMARAGARTLADAVEYTTGVRVENNCQNCNFSQIRLLGLDGPYTQILVDGQPVVSSLAQVYGIEQIPTRMIERIEVVKGGGSALYGPGSVGGVVNIIPREPASRGGVVELRTDTFGVDANLSLNGSADWVSGDRQTYLTLFGQLDRVRPFDFDDDGFTEVSRRELDATGVRFNRYQLSGRAKLTLDVTYLQEHRRGGDSVHLLPTQAQIAEQIDSKRTAVTGSWFHTVSRRFDYRFTASAADTERDSYYGTGGDPNAFGASTNRVSVFDTQLNHYAGRHTVSWGVQFGTEALDDRQPAYGRRTDVAYSNTGLYVQDDWAFAPRWQILLGLRGDAHSALDRPVLSPRVAVMHSPVPSLDIRLSVARGFRAPQVFDEDLHLSSVAGNVRLIHIDPALREERSANYMGGFEWKPEIGRGQGLLEVNAFFTALSDLFNVQEADDPTTAVSEFRKVNFGRASVYGLELNAGWGIGDMFVLQGGIVEQRARFGAAEPDFGSRDFFRTPRRYANGTVSWRIPRAADIFAAARYTGPMKAPHYAGYIAADRLETTPSFVLFDAAISRTFGPPAGPRLTVGLSARNLTDAYQPDLDRGPLRDAAYVYGPRFPRTIGASIKVDY